MQYKIEKDPINGKILSCTLIRENIPLFSDDLIIETENIPDLSNMNLMSVTDDGNFFEIENCNQEMENVQRNLAELYKENDCDCFLRFVMDGKELEEARNSITARRIERERLETEFKEIKERHERHIREHYISKDRESDKSLSFLYYSASILLIKDENKYLREWIDWHLGIGFEHIYIYDNGVNEHASEIINNYTEDVQKKITIIDWSGHHEQIQQDAYNHFLETYRKDVRWGLFIDSDEFVRFTNTEIVNVNDFLKQYEDYTEIWGASVEYNANGQETYENLPVRERFVETTDVGEGKVYKHFIQVNRIDRFLRHFAQYNRKKHFVFRNKEDNKNLFVIDHYYTKSWEEWRDKILVRGVCDPTYRKRLSEFFLYNPDMKYLDDGTEAIQSYENDKNNH